MKHTKKLLALLLTLATLLTALPVAALAAEEEALPAETSAVETAAPALQSAPTTAKSGSFGNLKWSLSGTKLTISGKGAMPNKVSSVPWKDYQYDITSVVIQSGVTSIGDDVFFCHFKLASVSIPNTVTSIGESAFYSCDSLTSIKIPASVTKIGDQAFTACEKLTSINVDAGNKNFCSVNGVLFNKNKTTLIAYPAGKKGTYSVPNGVKEIYFVAFFECAGLTGVSIPNTVKQIGVCAFQYCTSLTSVTIPASVQKIAAGAFGECPKLKNYVIQSKTVDIDGHSIGFAYNSSTRKTQTVSGLVIRGYNGSTAQTYAKNNSIAFKNLGSSQSAKPATPKISAIENVAKGTSGIKMTWGKVSAANSYDVYRRKHGASNWTWIATVTGTSYTDTDVRWNTGTMYDYAVVAVNGSARSAVSPSKTILRMAAPAITGLTNSAAKTIKATWSKNNSADGYQIWYQVGENASSRKIVTVYGSGTLSRTISGLTKGSSYKVFVRSFKKVNGTYYYSAWSASRTVKVSK